MRVDTESVLSALLEFGEDPSADRAEAICKHIESTSDALRLRAASWADQFRVGEPGYCDPEDAIWVMCDYPMVMFGDADEWVKWFDTEVAVWAEEGDTHRFDDMLLEPIMEPIVGIERGDQAFVWDGNHRLGASFKRGLTHIKAIVGMRAIDMTGRLDGSVLFKSAVQAARVSAARTVEGETGCPVIASPTSSRNNAVVSSVTSRKDSDNTSSFDKPKLQVGALPEQQPQSQADVSASPVLG